MGRTEARPSARSKKTKLPPAKQQKTKRTPVVPKKKKVKSYTAEELGVPKLNAITPVGVTKPRGKKKGKVFVDDADSMMTILALVNAEKEGQIESKMMKERQMEEIREARRKEIEKRDQLKKRSSSRPKNSLRKKRRRRTQESEAGEGPVNDQDSVKRTGKKVSFA